MLLPATAPTTAITHAAVYLSVIMSREKFIKYPMHAPIAAAGMNWGETAGINDTANGDSVVNIRPEADSVPSRKYKVYLNSPVAAAALKSELIFFVLILIFSKFLTAFFIYVSIIINDMAKICQFMCR